MSDTRDTEMPDTGVPEKDTPDPNTPDRGMPERDIPANPGMQKTMEPRSSRMEAGRQSALWPEFGEFRDRFHQIEMEFIDEPKAAVEKAESLIEEAVERMTRELRDHVERIHGNVKDADTEHLRMAMLSYREFMDSMGGRRVA